MDGRRSDLTAIAMICALFICMNVTMDEPTPLPSSKPLRWARISKSSIPYESPSLPGGARRTGSIPHLSGFCWVGRMSPEGGNLAFLPELQSRSIANYLKVLDAIAYGKGSAISLEND